MCPGNFRSTVVSLLTGLLFASMGEVVLAQSVSSEHLEEIVVTATRRPVSLEDVPVAITAITGADLENAGVARLEDLATQIPNTFIDTSSGLRSTDVTVRGISSNPNNPGVDPAVGVFVDGVYMSRPTTLNTNLYRFGAHRGRARAPRSAVRQEHDRRRHEFHHASPRPRISKVTWMWDTETIMRPTPLPVRAGRSAPRVFSGGCRSPGKSATAISIT